MKAVEDSSRVIGVYRIKIAEDVRATYPGAKIVSWCKSHLEIAVNGERRQKSNTKYLILGVAELVEMASAMYTLDPGDVVFTGTPEGVSPIEPGDQIVATIESIGTMTVSVRAAEEASSRATAGVAAATPG